METKELIEKTQAELSHLAQKIQTVNNQMAQLQQQQQGLVNEALKKQGALELLQSLNGTGEIKE